MSELVQRLREEQILERYDNGYLSQSWNRDGKEAANALEAQAKEIAELRAALTASPETIRLQLGEMTAQEMRTVRAAFSWALARAYVRVV